MTAIRPLGLVFQKEISGVILGRPLSQPAGIACDQAGNIFLADAGNSRIIKFNRDGQAEREVGGSGSGDGQLNGIGHIALDNNLNLYVSESGNRRISIFDSRLNYVARVDMIDPQDPLQFGRPSGVVMGFYGEIWVGDRDRSRVAIFDITGNFNRFIGGVESSSGYLGEPAGMVSDGDGNIYVCDRSGGLVKGFDRHGVNILKMGSGTLKEPIDIAIDRRGNLWVADRGLPGLFCFDLSGRLLWSSAENMSIAELMRVVPEGIGVPDEEHLIISDGNRDILQIYKILYP